MISRGGWIALSLALAATLGGCAARPAPTPSISPATASPARVEPTPEPNALTLADLGEGARSASFDDVLATDDGFVLVGSTGDDRATPAVFSSPDGIRWAQESISARPGFHPSELVRWGERVVALGGTHLGDCSDEGALDLWVRERDGTWSEMPPDPALCVSGPVAVVIFQDRPWLVGATRSGGPILAESHAGFTWTDHHGQLGEVMVDHAAADATGLWIFARTPRGSSITIHSQDGVAWSIEPFQTTSGTDIQVDTVTTVRGSIVVLGSTPSGGVRLVRVPGGGWGVAQMDGTFTPDFRSLSGGDGPLIGVSSGFAIEQGGVWVSGDGIAWHRIAIPPDVSASVSTVALHGDRVVFVTDGTVWSAPSSILAP